MIRVRPDQIIDAAISRNLRVDFRPPPLLDFPDGHEIALDGEDIFNAPRYDPDLLPSFEEPLTEYDCAYYERIGWKNYSPDSHFTVLHPLLAPQPLLYNSCHDLVVPFGGQNWIIDIDIGHDQERGPIINALTMVRTDGRPLTPQRDSWPRAYCTLFGQPYWKQGALYRRGSNGFPLRSFAVIENGWGDAGNVNVFVSLGPDGLPNRAYSEASCC